MGGRGRREGGGDGRKGRGRWEEGREGVMGGRGGRGMMRGSVSKRATHYHLPLGTYLTIDPND